MLIGIDARFYGSIGKGLGRYTQKLIEHLETADQENQYVIFLRRENFEEYQPKNGNFKKVLADYCWYTFKEQLFFPRLLNKYRFDLVHFPHFNVPLLYFGKFVITIHDLILIHFPTVRSSTLSPLFYWGKFLAYKIAIRSAISRSKKIIAVSEFTKKDILKTYKNVPENKIAVTYEACEDYCLINPKKDSDILKNYGIIKPYLLYVGNVYPHKNPERLIQAFQKLGELKSGISLVFVGGEDYFYARLKKTVKDQGIGNIVFAGFVHDSELDELFRRALAYIRPSLYEGFQLPPLEAMAKGCVVLSSDHECAKEILEDSALYFDTENVDEMVESVLKINKDENLRKDLVAKGYKQAAKFSWKTMAEKTLKIYID